MERRDHAIKHLRAWIAVLLLTGVALSSRAADKKVETYDDGTVKVECFVNDEGQKDGNYTEYYANGKTKLKARYRDGQLHGRHITYYESGREHVRAYYKEGKLEGKYQEKNEKGRTILQARYEDGKLHGPYKLSEPKKVVPEQAVAAEDLMFVRGALAYPKPLRYIQKHMAEIDPNAPRPGRSARRPPPRGDKGQRGKDGDEGFSAGHVQALQRLKAYRFLCDVPYEDVVLDKELNEYGAAGGEICDAVGKLTHHPKNPGWPEERYKYAYHATTHSNLHTHSSHSGGALLVSSVDGYMNDSDSRNISRVGHRRWCLNPNMAKVGFGAHGHYSAMMAHDNTRDPKCDWLRITYPARGYMPVAYFSNQHAWCVLLHPKKHTKPSKTAIKARVYAMDKRFHRQEEPLNLNYFNVDTGGYGHNWAIIFRPDGIQVRHGNRYWVEVDGVKASDGEDVEIRYVVEFVNLRK